MILQVYVTPLTLARLRASSEELGRSVEDLAESAVEEAALAAWRHRALPAVAEVQPTQKETADGQGNLG